MVVYQDLGSVKALLVVPQNLFLEGEELAPVRE
jgi:hypothetical protein